MHASMTSTKTGEHYLGAYISFKCPTNVNLSWCFPTTLWSSKVATLVERTPPSGCISKEKKRRLAQDKYNLTNGSITTGTNREQGKQQKVQIERQCQKVFLSRRKMSKSAVGQSVRGCQSQPGIQKVKCEYE